MGKCFSCCKRKKLMEKNTSVELNEMTDENIYQYNRSKLEDLTIQLK